MKLPGYSVKMTNEIKGYLLHEHNKRRNIIAGGKLKRYESAVRMTTIVCKKYFFFFTFFFLIFFLFKYAEMGR